MMIGDLPFQKVMFTRTKIKMLILKGQKINVIYHPENPKIKTD